MWITGKVIRDKVGKDKIEVQVMDSGVKVVLPRGTNQRIVDAKKGIKQFEVEERK